MSLLTENKKIKVVLNNKEIKCLNCLDTGAYWDEDQQKYINCDHSKQTIIKEEDNVEEIDTD
jgi:hypothetical protein